MRRDLESLRRLATEFRDERNWEQYHNPKDLAISLSIEAAELLELFQWKSAPSIELMSQDVEYRSRIGQELADVLIYLLLLSERLNIDLYEACVQKIALNREKYPVDKAYGKSTKYDEL